MTEKAILFEQRRQALRDKAIGLINRDRVEQNIENARIHYESGCVLDAAKRIWSHFNPQTEKFF